MVAKKINILFVCTANICRSPMAEYLFRSRLGPNLPWAVGSAGLAAVNGLAASQTAIEVMNEIGIDIKTHRSRELIPELVDMATIILGMTSAHVTELKQRFPKARDRVYLLGSFNQNSENHATAACGGCHWRTSVAGKDISDPVGASREVYHRTLNDIGKCFDGLICYLQSYQANKNNYDKG